MPSVRNWLRGRRLTASIVVASLVVAVPVTFAVLHPGYPVSDVDLEAKDVWVTNGTELLAGRLNRQIEELDASVATRANDIDVFQNGDLALLHDRVSSTVERIDPAYTTLTEQVSLPPGAELAFGGSMLAVLAPGSGSLWITNVANGLNFTTVDNPALLKLGEDAQIAVSSRGTVYAASASKKKLYTFAVSGGAPSERSLPSLSTFQLSAAGENAVILDEGRNVVLVKDGTEVELPEKGMRLQQASASDDVALVSGAKSLMAVPLAGGDVSEVDAKITAAARKAADVADPVNLNGCWHAAWSQASRYLAECAEKQTVYESMKPSTAGAKLEFRVNRNVIALNNLLTGDTWLVDANMRLVRNWEEVTPPEEEEGEEGDEKSSIQSFEDTLAERTDQNRAPLANPDAFGVRPNRTTVLPLLDNDTDPDGDVLTIIDFTAPMPELGTFEYIDGHRALQFTPKEDAQAGTVSFRYTVSDGREGGIGETTASVTIQPQGKNKAPVSQRVGATAVETGQTISYNALTDWRDPDGDDLYLESAASDAGDRVRFSPDGFITVTHTSGQIGPRDIVFTVSDGTTTSTGTFTLDVKAAGSLNPVGTPDYAETFVGESVEIAPLDNDLSPSGGQLNLLETDGLSGGLAISPNVDTGTITVSAGKPGAYYIKYSLGAGTKSSIGLIRVEVTERGDADLSPIAVRDTGYLRPNEPTSIAVLANDVSPTGAVLAVQSIDIPDEAGELSVELLSQSIIRVTASAAVTQQVQFSYTVSDGKTTSTTTVTVVPVPPLTSHQAPIAADDHVKVRAGDIASVPVLDNDIHPDNAVMKLDQKLARGAEKGLAFVTGNHVRYQAPEEAGTYTSVYTVIDDFGQSAVATVTFVVIAPDPDTNTAPVAKTLTTRVFADSSVVVNIPLDGLDPEGDSVVFDGLASAPLLGEVRNPTSTSFEYQAGKLELGTDTFTYKLVDVNGATTVGTIKIAVIARPDQSMSPVAVDDKVQVQPGRIVTVPVLANDTDPNQYSFKTTKKLSDVPDGVTARVTSNNVVIEAPDMETTFIVGYTIRNEKGATDKAYVTVWVTKDATIQPPGVEDHIVEQKDALNKKTVDIDIYDGATNAGGLVDDLVATLEGPNADKAEILDNGKVRVTLGEARTAITFRLTNAVDRLSSAAFIVVPPFSDGQPPRIKLTLPEQIVDMNTTKTWNLDFIAESPTGKDIRITGPKKMAATRSNGDSNYVDEKSLRYTPAKDYRGPASLSFEVSDGSATGTALLVLPITVGDPGYEDVPPTFTPPTVSIEAGADPTPVDLRASSSHQNPSVIQQLTYSNLRGESGGIVADLSGSLVNVSAPFGIQPGTAATLKFTMKFKDFDVTGEVNVRVVASTKPLPQVVDHLNDNARSSTPVRFNALVGSFNPFGDEHPLDVVSAKVQTGNATANTDGTTVTVSPGPEKHQTISVIYTVQDATGESARQVSARITVVVISAPEAPPAPSLSAGDRSISVTVHPTVQTNGADVTSYTVTRTPGDTSKVCAAGAACSFAGDNGVNYSFRVVATNKVGNSAPSAASSATSYGVPGAPQSLNLTNDSPYAASTFTLGWAKPTDDGGQVKNYNWEFSNGQKASTSSLNAKTKAVGKGTYSFKVQACSPAGCGAWATSGSKSISDPPPPPVPKITKVWGWDGPKTRSSAQYGNVTNTWKIQFSWENYDGRTYKITPQFCQNGVGWMDVYESVDVKMDGSGTYQVPDGWATTNNGCGVRVLVNGVASDAFPWST